MAKFISFTQDNGTGFSTVFINVDQIASAKYDPKEEFLEVFVAGGREAFELTGQEAKDAAAAIRSLV